MATFNFTTGPATLPDVGELSYNGCIFSPLFETNVSCTFVKDAANRTITSLEYEIVADGYVTLPTNVVNIESTLATLERLLSKPAGRLVYAGRSISLRVNDANNLTSERDVAWGPFPEVLEIQPLGGGRSAKIKWRVKTRIPPKLTSPDDQPWLQFNFDTSTSYDEQGYCSFVVRGVLEIPLTRRTPDNRSVPQTADEFRGSFVQSVGGWIDSTRFHWIKREFNISRDKRTLEFSAEAQELPWMAMPPGCTVARGTFQVRPARQGLGLCNWLCSLNCTYTVRKDLPRRTAWLAFLALLRERMLQGNLFGIAPAPGDQNPGPIAAIGPLVPIAAVFPVTIPWLVPVAMWRFERPRQNQRLAQAPQRSVFLMDFGFSEGIHLDSRTVTFNATWKLVCHFALILAASGLWKKVGAQNENTWSASMRDIVGGKSWLENRVAGDVIVDFGGP